MKNNTWATIILGRKKGQTITTNDPFSPLFEITDYPNPLGVLFVVHGTYANQPRSHAGHTSVTQALTKAPELLESMEITLRCEATVGHCFHCGKWCPGADSNHRHADFQSAALPTELPGRSGDNPVCGRGRSARQGV